MSTRIVVMGGGLAGLCAGWALREQSRGELEVELIERGHFLGGKASSMAHRHQERVYEIDHGYHAFFDYPNLDDLLRRFGGAGALKPNRHRMYMYWRGQMRSFRAWPLPAPLHMAPTVWHLGLTAAWHFFRFYLASALFRIDRVSNDERRRLDELPMQEYARNLGMPDALIETELFRFFSRSAFNWPHPTSALSMLRAIRLVSQDYRSLLVRYLDGPSGTVIVDPIARAYADAGGTARHLTFIEQIRHDGRRVTGVEIKNRRRFPHGAEAGSPDLSFYHTELLFGSDAGAGGGTHNHNHDDDGAAPRAGYDAPELLEADYYIGALPPRDLVGVLDKTALSMPYFANVARIETQPTIAYQVYYDRKVTPPDFVDALVAIPGPFSTIFDRSRVWSRPDGDGSILELVGELGEYTGSTPEELMALGDAQIAQFFPDVRDATVIKRYFHIGRHDEFTMTTRGSDAWRPAAASPFDNLVLAGDFTDNRFGIMSMEGAVTSGLEAANLILRATGHPPYPIRDLREAGGLLPLIGWLLRATGLLERAVGFSERS